MALPNPPAPDLARDPRKSRLLRVLYTGTKAQVERGACTLSGHTRAQSPTGGHPGADRQALERL